MQKYRVCAFFMVLSMLFSTLSVGVSASTTESECFVSYDNTTGTIQYEYYSVEEQSATFYSPPGDGDVERIEDVYNQINEMYAESNLNDDLITPYSIIGSDDRTKVGAEICTPYSRICYLEITWPDGTIGRGTGWLYSRNRVATAGHCLYKEKYGGWAESILVQPGRYGDYAPFGEAWSTFMLTSENWIENENKEYDYGLIQLSEPLGDVCGFFGYGANMGSVGTKVTVGGYPGDKNPRETGEEWQWQMSGRIILATGRNLYYLIDTQPGQSGAPIYTADNIVVGIHTTSNVINNKGTRLTSAICQLMLTW